MLPDNLDYVGWGVKLYSNTVVYRAVWLQIFNICPVQLIAFLTDNKVGF